VIKPGEGSAIHIYSSNDSGIASGIAGELSIAEVNPVRIKE
jgi:hypothetical protein